MLQKLFYIKTFGCQMNIRDSEIIAQTFSVHGYVETSQMDDADVVILNTCSIRAKAEQKVLSLLGYLRKEKANRPELKICVAGCVAQQEGNQLLSRMPHIDLIVGTQNIYQIPKLLAQCNTQGRVVTTLSESYSIPKLIPDTADAATATEDSGGDGSYHKFVTIMQGCNNFCTYCVVPYTRGREISRSVADILEEIRVLLQSGVTEITLLGQNVNSYGRTNSVTDDGAPYSFSDLLQKVATLEGLKRLRFTTSNPKDLSDELIECFSTLDILCPQFHLPVQSGSDAVLKRMNRNYSIASYLEQVEKLRHHRPEIAITTDVIVGFPGETDEDFQATMDLLETVRFHGSFSFKYSDRPGTRSIDFEDKVAEDVKSARLSRFQQRQDEISLERNREYVGKKLEIVVAQVGEDSFMGRTATNHIVHVDEQCSVVCGQTLDVEIFHAGKHSLKGKCVL